jgi:uncharacterized protein
MRPVIRLAAVIATCAVFAQSCALTGGRSDSLTFFALTSIETSDGALGGSWDAALGLGPVVIPDYLDRPQLVTRVGPNEIRLARVARWAEPLREGVARTLQLDLLTASGARHVALYPWPSTEHLDFAVAVYLLRFEPQEHDQVELLARWRVRDLRRGSVLPLRESRFTERIDATGDSAAVAALSRALGALGREIAAAVREMPAR